MVFPNGLMSDELKSLCKAVEQLSIETMLLLRDVRTGKIEVVEQRSYNGKDNIRERRWYHRSRA